MRPPDLVPPGALVLQPNEERRRSGSNYTPRELTEPIVRHALAPILARLRGDDGEAPTPAEILDLKICDPAMGSGAFLVETCRQLADALIEAWGAHGKMPTIPPDEDEVIHARRLVAQRCLYGIDRNPMAVDLAKMSLWLSTLARDHPLTFVDHAFRHGDSLVGLSRAGRSKHSTGSPRHRTLPGWLRGDAGARARSKRGGASPAHPGGGAKRSPTKNCTLSGTTRATKSTRFGSTATSPSPHSSPR